MLYPTNLPNMSFLAQKYKQQEQSLIIPLLKRGASTHLVSAS